MRNNIFDSIYSQFSPDERLKEKVIQKSKDLKYGRKTIATDIKERQNDMSIKISETSESANSSIEMKSRWGLYASVAAVVVLAASATAVLGISNSGVIETQESESTPAKSIYEKPYTPEDDAKPREVQEWAKDMLERNDEVVGWIKIPGFVDENGEEYINYPVLQHDDNDDNDYYLSHNIDKKPDVSGSIFTDGQVPIDENGQADNITIYGHNMGDIGTMFTHLTEYASSVDFLKEHPMIEFNTIYDNDEEYAIIGCFNARVTEEYADGYRVDDDYSSVFDFWRYRNFGEEGHEFDTWINTVRAMSMYSCDIQCDPDDKYITLSTMGETADVRWVIVAKKLDEADDKAAIIDSYKENPEGDIYLN